jgi:hypothetical protein
VKPSVEYLKAFVDDLIAEGERVMASRQAGTNLVRVDFLLNDEAFASWLSSCRLLCGSLGEFAKIWRPVIEGEDTGEPFLNSAQKIQGALKSIKAAIEKGRLIRLDDLAQAEIFSDLVEQAEYLLEKKYFLPAGVILRAVLEERLRQLCVYIGSMPQRTRPTLSDFNQALYKAQQYDKTVMKQIDHLADIGNRAAHGDQTLTFNDVEKLKSGVRELLVRLSV